MATLGEHMKAAGIDQSSLPAAVRNGTAPVMLPDDPPPPREPGMSDLVASFVGIVRSVGHHPNRRFLVAGAMPRNVQPEHHAHRRVIIWSSQDEHRWRGKDIPAGVGFVFILHWIKHPASDAVVAACKRANVPYAMGLSSGDLRQLLDIGLGAKADVIAPVEADVHPQAPEPPDNRPPEWQRLAPVEHKPRPGVTISDAIRHLLKEHPETAAMRHTDAAEAILPEFLVWYPGWTHDRLLKAIANVRAIDRWQEERALQAVTLEPLPQAPAVVAPEPAPPVEKPVPSIEDALAAIDGAAHALVAASDALQTAREAVLHARATASEDIAQRVEDGLLELAANFTATLRAGKPAPKAAAK